MNAVNGSRDPLVKAIERIAAEMSSPNECDRNWEPANMVDGLFDVARAIRFLAKATLVAHGKTMKDYREALDPNDR
jgi:hypothetical protein